MQEENLPIGFDDLGDGRIKAEYIGKRDPIALRAFAKVINDYADGCNVATVKVTNTLFTSCDEPDVQTIEIDEPTLRDFQTLQGEQGEDIRKSIIALIAFYADLTPLNLILKDDVLQTRQSYTKFTAQLAQYLRTNQEHYRAVQVEYDQTQERLGVFCRHTPTMPRQKFLGSVIEALDKHEVFHIPDEQIPRSYKTNRALLKSLLKKEGKLARVEWSDSGVKIFRQT